MKLASDWRIITSACSHLCFRHFLTLPTGEWILKPSRQSAMLALCLTGGSWSIPGSAPAMPASGLPGPWPSIPGGTTQTNGRTATSAPGRSASSWLRPCWGSSSRPVRPLLGHQKGPRDSSPCTEGVKSKVCQSGCLLYCPSPCDFCCDCVTR